MDATRARLTAQILAAGVRPGAPLLVHSSLSSLGRVAGGADTVIDALLAAVGPGGTLCMPTLSYLFTTEDSPTFDVASTPTNLGIIPETFRKRHGVLRSLHPTHSVAAFGAQAADIVGEHGKDRSPVGANSPFRRVRDLGGQVAFLGCGTRCNTSIHGVEELLDTPPPYLFQDATITYTVTDAAGKSESATHRRHSFETGKPFLGRGTGQRYDRVVQLLPRGAHHDGIVGQATMHVMEAAPMWEAALAALESNPLCLVEPIPANSEGHHLKQGQDGNLRYEVGYGPVSPATTSESSGGTSGHDCNESELKSRCDSCLWLVATVGVVSCLHSMIRTHGGAEGGGA